MARSRSTRPVRRPSQQATGLLRQLTGNTHLASYVQQLPATALRRLIDAIGLEDSHEIVAAIGPEQMQALLSVALWSHERPGEEETLDLEQLVRWLDLWMDDGEPTLARRVVELGEDFFGVCLTKLATVFDRTLVGVEDGGLEIGPYLLFPRQESHWHRIVAMLTTLWHHEPDFLLHTLRRCAFERSILNDDIREHGDSETGYDDVAARRATERQSLGYVDPTHASMFLLTAKTGELETFCNAREPDLTAAEYLRKSLPPASSVRADTSTEPTETRAKEIERESFATLDALLRDAGVIEDRQPVAALLQDQRSISARPELLERALALLAREAPELASQRLRELAFLSNVLMSGTVIQGQTFTEKTAAQVAMVTANLGLDYLLVIRGERSADPMLAVQWLRGDAGEAQSAIRLFQIGYHLLCTLPRRCAIAIYRAKAALAERPGRVLLREMDELLGSSLLLDRVDEGAHGEAKALIDGLSRVMDSAACVALRQLIDPLPCFPRVLESHPNTETVYVDQGHRYIATMDDLETIAAFLEGLPNACGR